MIELLVGAIVVFILAVAGIYIFDHVKNKPKDIKETNPTAWLINEELERMHKLFNSERGSSSSNTNLNIYWNKIQELQKELSRVETSK